MTRIGLILAALLLGTATARAAPCTQSATVLCLSGGRFEVKVAWKDFSGSTGNGQATALTADTGHFWFFSPSNVELIVKVLDARALNNKFWVFFGALSNVEYTLTVTDSVTGAEKTYINPSGRFASVGDTAAFDATASGAVLASRSTVASEGTTSPPSSMAEIQAFIDHARAGASKTAAAVAPCRGIANTLGLASCRFALQVSWTDSAGNRGRGVPVQLSNDTGYFWFFSPNNVELVVKVLDARAITGGFWVFYGALSNVAYELTVTDSLSGVVRRYTNPGGTFASVGDTAAFRAGRSVAPVADAGRSVSAAIDSNGGSISATASNGTQFVLEIPPDALGETTSVRMTPLSRVDGLPLSRGLIGGVRLEPEGLRLFVPATLRIRPPTPLRLGAVAFSYAGNGDEFALGLNEVSRDEMKLQLLHFSGYGAGNPGPGDVAHQQSFPPGDPIAAIQQRALEILERSRPHLDENDNEIPAELTAEQMKALLSELIVNAFRQIVFPVLDAASQRCNPRELRWACELVLATIRCALLMELGGPEIEAITSEAFGKVIEALTSCLDQAHRDCVAFKDPFKVWDMVLIGRQLELLGADNGLSFETGGPIESCLRFELQFDSSVSLTRPGISEQRTARARIPLRLDSALATNDLAWSGSAPVYLTDIEAHVSGCTTTSYDLEDGTAFVGNGRTTLIPIRLSSIAEDPEQFTNLPIVVVYDPGNPLDSVTASCSGVPTEFYHLSGNWKLMFDQLHLSERLIPGAGLVGDYVATDWELFNLAGLFARKTYQGTKTAGVNIYTEDTEIIIKHTPDDEP